MNGEFKLEIALGNEAMNDRFSIADALRRVADRLESRVELSRAILDANGNTVGTFWIEDAEIIRPMGVTEVEGER